MIRHSAFTRIFTASGVLALALAAPPAFAVNKEMVQLQTQVQQLQDAVARLQQSNDERMGVLKDLVQQNADSVNKMSQAFDALQQSLRGQQDASGGKMDQISGQVQTLSDSVDEVKARLDTMQKALGSLRDQQQSINAALQSLAPNGGVTGGAPATAANSPATPPPAQPGLTGDDQPQMQPANASAKPSADIPFATHQGPPITAAANAAAATGAPPAADLYNTALSDYMAAKYALASSEFNQVTQVYPDDPLAGNSYYYLAEIDYRQGKYQSAIKNYDHVLQHFPASSKGPVSRLHKGMALLATRQREAGIAEMRALIQRYPNSPEAAQARSKLNGMGVPIYSKRPS